LVAMSILHALLGITTDLTNYGPAESCRLPESSRNSQLRGRVLD
jgi:hypothetical protein